MFIEQSFRLLKKTEPSSDGFPGGFLDQRFERWVVRCHEYNSALQRASDRGLWHDGEGFKVKPVETG